jgi:hypothetical protein
MNFSRPEGIILAILRIKETDRAWFIRDTVARCIFECHYEDVRRKRCAVQNCSGRLAEEDKLSSGQQRSRFKSLDCRSEIMASPSGYFAAPYGSLLVTVADSRTHHFARHAENSNAPFSTTSR